MADVGMWTGINQGVQNLTSTGMKLMEFRANREHQQRLEANQAAQLKMAQDQAQIQNASATIDLEKKRKEQAFLQSGWEPAIDPLIKVLPEQDQKGFVDTINQMGVPKTQEGRQQTYKILKSNQELFKEYSASLYKGISDKYSTAEEEYNAALEKGADPEKIAALKQKYDAATQAVHKARGDIDKGIKTVAMNELWNQLPPEVKQIPAIKSAYQIGARTGDTSQFDKAMIEITKEASAATIRGNTEAATNKRAEEANKTRIEAANIGAAARTTPKPAAESTPANDRLLGKEKTDVEVKLLEGKADDASATAYATRYNELSKTDEYVKQTKVNKWMPDEVTWVKQKKSGGTATTTAKPPAGFVDSGKTSGGKKVYVKGDQAWIAP